MARKIRSKAGKRILDRIINSYLLAQENPIDKEKLRSLQVYLREKGFGRISTKELAREIKKQQKKMKRNKKMSQMETELFKKDDEPKKYRYGSSFCPNCTMYKDNKKECPYCGKLELTR